MAGRAHTVGLMLLALVIAGPMMANPATAAPTDSATAVRTVDANHLAEGERTETVVRHFDDFSDEAAMALVGAALLAAAAVVKKAA